MAKKDIDYDVLKLRIEKLPPEMVYLTDHEVSFLTGIGVQTLRNTRIQKKEGIPYIKMKKLVRYRLKDVQDYMQLHTKLW